MKISYMFGVGVGVSSASTNSAPHRPLNTNSPKSYSSSGGSTGTTTTGSVPKDIFSVIEPLPELLTAIKNKMGL